MVKAAAGISDDDPLEEAFEKLRGVLQRRPSQTSSAWPRASGGARG
jgi:hypothetical protein